MVLEAIKLAKKEAPELAIAAWQLGPFTMAGQLLELDIMLKGVFKQKELVEAALDKISDMIIKIGQAQQAAGADFITLREMGTGTDLISPRTWKTMIMPRVKRILAAWESPKVLHICGATDMISVDGAGALDTLLQAVAGLSDAASGDAQRAIVATLEQEQPALVEALAKDDVKTLEDFATCADWELAAQWSENTADYKRSGQAFVSSLQAEVDAGTFDLYGVFGPYGDKEISAAMREKGLGTPATRAAIIEGLLKRKLLQREGKTIRAPARLVMTDFGAAKRAGAVVKHPCHHAAAAV